MDKKLTVATTLQNVELINLKIQENKRLAAIEADKFKQTFIKDDEGNLTKVKNHDLRKSPVWNALQKEINNLIATRRKIIMETDI